MDEIETTRLRFDDQLEGASNDIPWKEMIALVSMENEEFVDTNPLVRIDATYLSKYNKTNVKSRRIILDAMKDHVIPHLSKIR